ncbi:undecaprenyl-diphosphate phosphatase [bacterium]|nr:undecaprenyl-diphosphate phosphatase [bacterium]
MYESIILGSIQGVAEWLPVSSEGLIFLVKSNFFPDGGGINEIVKLALFLHFGTFLAALIYFYKDIFRLIKTLFNYNKSKSEDKKIFNFLFVTTIISASLGFLIYYFSAKISQDYLTAQSFTLVVGVLLLVTAYLQFKTKNITDNLRGYDNINYKDKIILGLAQSFAAFPGLSRSGLTVSALLLLKFKEGEALKLSFLMSLPIVLGGNIILNLDKFVLNKFNFLALLFSFLLGFLTIDLLLKIAKKINFAWFVLGFGLLTILSVFLF